MRSLFLGTTAALILLASGHLNAQSFSTAACPSSATTHEGDWFSGHDRFCELRRTTLALVNGQLSVSGKNGSIEVIGENRSDIAFEAQVVAQAGSLSEAESLAHEVKIVTSGTIEAQGPSTSGFTHRNWSVSYHLRVPNRLAAHLHTENGSLKLADLDGIITADTTNGSVTLHALSGSVHVSTTNGSLNVTLAGDRWKGSGLSARTTNGHVAVEASNSYSAHLVASTVNGGMKVDFPASFESNRRRHFSHIDTNIGQGGATLEFQTVNGGVRINRL